MFRKFSIPLILIILVFGACKKKNKVVDDPIPYQTVNFTIYPGDPMYFKLQVAGGWMYVNGGVNGIIIYRKAVNSGADFVALERTSTYLPNDSYALAKVRSNNFTCRDTVSGSEWQIVDGVVIQGPATLPLRQYRTYYDGNALRITN